ncbi:hypothetical protein C9427_21695 [Mesorhizobium helmanticense]|uniref:Uncharacterized protein n=2 Tax=Mesorhizobium helmanticense TaxID=1776423 RepID=A0A2T4IRV3_9HYPH|nr:hypothetical protein C9427_21695 [Mesorhizobium helmanticense]
MNKGLDPFKRGARIGRSPPIEYFILVNLQSDGAIIGHLAGQPIPETVVDASGHRYRYVGVAPRAADGRFDVDSLHAGEWIVRPGLVYLMDEKGARPRKV